MSPAAPHADAPTSDAPRPPEGHAAALARLVALEAEGALVFDAELCECIHGLLARAQTLGGTAGERLVARAEDYCSTLAQQFTRERARSAELLAVLEQSRGPQPELREQLGRGALTELKRRARRLRARPWAKAPPPSARKDELARVNVPVAKRPRAAKSVDYDDSVAEMVASFALARAVDVVPKDAGPYNPLRIASGLLDSLRAVSPFFLTVQLNRLEELGSLLNLPDLPEKAPAPAPPPSKKKAPPRKKS